MQATFVLWTYCPDATPTTDERAAHLDYLERLVADGRLIAAGPRGDQPGGVLLFRGTAGAELDALLAADPFSAITLITGTELVPWTVAVGAVGAAATVA